MRILAGLSMALLFSGVLFGQHPGSRGASGGYRRGGGYHLGGGAPSAVRGGAVVVPYAYPVYLGSGYYYPPSYADSYTDGTPPPPQSNVVVVAPQPAPPAAAGPEPVSPYEPATAQTTDDQTSADHYLIALKDHTIYSVVAYWVDGDTLHYFTPGNVHNQASLSLVDRDLTARLNKESGQEVNLPDVR